MQREWLIVSKPLRAPFRDGTTVLARDLVRGLAPSISLSYFGDPAAPLRDGGHVVSAGAMGYAPGMLGKAGILAGIMAPAQRRLPVHFFFTPGPVTSAVVDWLARLQPGRPLIQTLTSSFGVARQARRLKSLDAVVTLSEHTRDILLQAGLEPGRVRTIHPGVEVPKESISDPAAARRLLYAGDLDAASVANLLSLVRAFDERPELEGWSLTVASRPKDDDVRALLHDLRDLSPSRERVTLLGEIDDMDALYRSCSLQVFCADHVRRKVDIPLVLLEGCARGLPLVALDVAPPREFFAAARERGLEPGALTSADGLVETVAQAAGDSDRLAGWGRDARATVEQAFSTARMLRAYEALYAELA